MTGYRMENGESDTSTFFYDGNEPKRRYSRTNNAELTPHLIAAIIGLILALYYLGPIITHCGIWLAFIGPVFIFPGGPLIILMIAAALGLIR